MAWGVIEDGVPLPQSQRTPKYPWDKLKIGQSFAVQTVTRAEATKRAQLMRVYLYDKTRKSKHSLAFKVRLVCEYGVEYGFRFWRVK